MIIRRISENIKKHDWFVVVVEILILVVGVYIGLQADAWNQDRKDRVEELVYLERLVTDMERDLEILGLGRSLSEDRIRQIRLLEAIVANPQVAVDSPGQFLRYLETASWASYLPIGPRTYEELMSSGRTTLIRDPELRDALADYYRSIERWDVILQGEVARYAFQQASAGILSSDQLVAIEASDEANFDIPGTEPDAVLALAHKFAANNEAVRFLPQMLHYHVLVDEVINRHEQSANEMLETLNSAMSLSQ